MATTTMTPLQTDSYSERTQISLSSSLRRVIDASRLLTNESLSEYIRNAVGLRIANEEQNRKYRRQAAQVFVGSVRRNQYPEWRTEKSVLAWQRRLRKEKV